MTDTTAAVMTPRDRLWSAISSFAFTATTEPIEPRKAAVDAAIDALIAASRPNAAQLAESAADATLPPPAELLKADCSCLAHRTSGGEACERVSASSPEERQPGYDMSIHSNPDACAWARFFMETYNRMQFAAPDEEMMIGWFANAMMAMYDHRAASPEERQGAPACDHRDVQERAYRGEARLMECAMSIEALRAALASSTAEARRERERAERAELVASDQYDRAERLRLDVRDLLKRAGDSESRAEALAAALREALAWARGGIHRRVPHELEARMSAALAAHDESRRTR